MTCASSDRIAVVDPRGDSLLAALEDSAPGGTGEGSTPNGLALADDGRRLYVAEADNDAVAVFALAERTSGLGAGAGRDSLLGRIPVEWYPASLLARGDSLWALNAKGRGTGPNPGLGQPGLGAPEDRTQYTLGQTSGSLSALAVPTGRELARLSGRVAVSNGWIERPRGTRCLHSGMSSTSCGRTGHSTRCSAICRRPTATPP